jgi:calcineurin-like phosphoesterase family protein
MLVTHIPIHPDSIGRNKINIFGHTHDNKQGTLGPKYFCMCAEALNYTPISLEDVKKKAQDQIGETW